MMQEITAKLLRTLEREQVPATGFVNEIKLFADDQLDPRTMLLEAWLDAGFDEGAPDAG